MGISCMGSTSSSSYDYAGASQRALDSMRNPDPSKFTIHSIWEWSSKRGRYALVSISYDNCVGFERNKLLLYKGLTADQIQRFKNIDPHFSNSTQWASPIARFAPTTEGGDMARTLVHTLLGEVQC